MSDKHRKTIGLALGSGGWRGLAHLGILKELQRHHIPIDYIAGCSTGALIGGLYSYFEDTQKIETIVNSLSYRSLYKILLEPAVREGLVKGEKLVKFLEKHVGQAKLEDLKINFHAVTADLFTGQAVILKTGQLSIAIRASSSIPLIFQPVKHQSRHLIDGGAAMPVPVDVVRQMGADIVIAVNLYNHLFPFKREYLKKSKLTLFNVSGISYHMLLYNLAQQNIKSADLLINPQIWEGHFNIFKFRKFINNPETIEVGAQAARKIIPQLKKLLSA